MECSKCCGASLWWHCVPQKEGHKVLNKSAALLWPVPGTLESPQAANLRASRLARTAKYWQIQASSTYSILIIQTIISSYVRALNKTSFLNIYNSSSYEKNKHKINNYKYSSCHLANLYRCDKWSPPIEPSFQKECLPDRSALLQAFLPTLRSICAKSAKLPQYWRDYAIIGGDNRSQPHSLSHPFLTIPPLHFRSPFPTVPPDVQSASRLKICSLLRASIFHAQSSNRWKVK